jgi:hypothetical protein
MWRQTMKKTMEKKVMEKKVMNGGGMFGLALS